MSRYQLLDLTRQNTLFANFKQKDPCRRPSPQMDSPTKISCWIEESSSAKNPQKAVELRLNGNFAKYQPTNDAPMWHRPFSLLIIFP